MICMKWPDFVVPSFPPQRLRRSRIWQRWRWRSRSTTAAPWSPAKISCAAMSEPDSRNVYGIKSMSQKNTMSSIFALSNFHCRTIFSVQVFIPFGQQSLEAPGHRMGPWRRRWQVVHRPGAARDRGLPEEGRSHRGVQNVGERPGGKRGNIWWFWQICWVFGCWRIWKNWKTMSHTM